MAKIAYQYTEPKNEQGAEVKAAKFLSLVAQQDKGFKSVKGARIVYEDMMENELMADALGNVNVEEVWNTGITRRNRGNVWHNGDNFRFTFPADEKGASVKASQIKSAVAKHIIASNVENAVGIVRRITENCELMASALAGFDVETTWANEKVNGKRTGRVYDIPDEE